MLPLRRVFCHLSAPSFNVLPFLPLLSPPTLDCSTPCGLKMTSDFGWKFLLMTWNSFLVYQRSKITATDYLKRDSGCLRFQRSAQCWLWPAILTLSETRAERSSAVLEQLVCSFWVTVLRVKKRQTIQVYRTSFFVWRMLSWFSPFL